VVLDAFSRRIVGWAMANNLKTELVLDALEMALEQRRPGLRLVVHCGEKNTRIGGCEAPYAGWRNN
jgi:putative transposase